MNVPAVGVDPIQRVDAVEAPSFPRRFRTRVFLYIAALSLATSGGSAAVYYSRQVKFIEQDRARRASTLLSGLAAQAELGAYAGDPALCDLAVRRTFSQDDVVLAAVYDRRGRELMRLTAPALNPPAPSFDVRERMVSSPDAPPMREMRAGGTGEGYEDLYAPILTGTRDIDETLSSASGDQGLRREVVGIARVGLSLRGARAQLEEVVRTGEYLALGLLAVGICAAWLVSRLISRPIAALTRGADQIRAGELDTRVAVESKDEIGQLAYSFNRMAERLHESIGALETLNRDLEKEVERRTAEIERAAAFTRLLNAPLGDLSKSIPPGEQPATNDIKDNLERLLGDALLALMHGTGATAGLVWLSRDEAVEFELEFARCIGAPPESFGSPPGRSLLAEGVPVRQGNRLVVPLRLGDEPEGCVVLQMKGPPSQLAVDFAQHAAVQLAIAVGNVRAYAATAHLARELKARNAVLHRQRDQLQEMNRLKSEFLASISHELRTPLNAIIGYTELIHDGIYGGVTLEQSSALEGIDESGHNLLGLINQILDLSKIEAGRMTVHLEEIDMNEVVRAVLSEAAPLAKDRPYQLEFKAYDPVRLRSDRAKIQQIVTNLVSNAIKFTAEGQVEVAIRAERAGGCTIAVRDTGIGIRPEDMQIIFEEFRQVDGSYTREFGGTGLGLAIAKRFAELLGGKITVASKLGLGSIFTLHLPAEPPERKRQQTVPPPLPKPALSEVKTS